MEQRIDTLKEGDQFTLMGNFGTVARRRTNAVDVRWELPIAFTSNHPHLPPECPVLKGWVGNRATAVEHICENCGLPAWAVTGAGISVSVETKPENRYRRTRKRTVWCHDDECAIQCLAVARYGRASSKWPITLAQFRATKPLAQSQPQKPTRSSLEYKQARMKVRVAEMSA